MNNDLRDTISSLAATFATSVVAAIRNSSLEDILDLAHEARSAPPRHVPAAAPKAEARARASRLKRTPARSPKKATAPVARPAAAPSAKAATPAAKSKRTADGRLARRSPADIARALERVLTHLKANKSGLRSEQIRDNLKMDKKEMPRVLKEGLTKKVLRSKGLKRSTVYSAT